MHGLFDPGHLRAYPFCIRSVRDNPGLSLGDQRQLRGITRRRRVLRRAAVVGRTGPLPRYPANDCSEITKAAVARLRRGERSYSVMLKGDRQISFGTAGASNRTIRFAHCCCGALRAETTGEPTVIPQCHCRECQRRTGAPFGVGAYFKKEQVRTEGAFKVYIRGSDSGRQLRMHFCPE